MSVAGDLILSACCVELEFLWFIVSYNSQYRIAFFAQSQKQIHSEQFFNDISYGIFQKKEYDCAEMAGYQEDFYEHGN